MSKKRTHEEFIKEVELNNPYIEIIGKYINVDTPILVKCLICGTKYMARPQIVLRGGVHKNCVRKVKQFPKPKSKTHEQFINEIEALGKNIDVLGQYINRNTKILVRCRICGEENWMLPCVLLRPNTVGCNNCSKEIARYKMRKSHEVFVKEVKSINPHVDIISTYTIQDEKINVRCKICGHVHSILAVKLLTRIYNCPVCSDKISFPNKFMNSLLTENNIEFIPEKVFDWSNNKRYDFYIPSTSTIIEMNGLQHYKEPNKNSGWDYSLNEVQQNDEYKKNVALKNDIINYIVIDASESSVDFLVNSIKNSDVGFLLDNIDISTVLEKCLLQSKVIDVVDLYNQGMSARKISKQLCISRGSCDSYVKLAKDAKLIS